MAIQIPYYIFDENGDIEFISSDKEAYIDDDDLKELLIELFGDKVSLNDIEKILKAASDENLSESDFDKLIDDFIFKNMK